MLSLPPVRKLVIELRYKPELSFYGRMDTVGMKLGEQFPDWERSPLTVEVRNKKKHRRVFLCWNRCFYEADLESADPNREFECAQGTLCDVCSALSVHELKRVGVRQWFACDTNKAFAAMVDEITDRFLHRGEELRAILTDNVHDVAYVVDYETHEGWKYHLRLGPMTKEQWFQVVHYEPGIFVRLDEDASTTFEEYRKTLPDNFLFVDIDCYQDEVPTDRFGELVTTFRRRSHEIVSKLIRYCRE